MIANNYSLNVTDANGCEETANKALTNPTTLSAQVSNIISPLCNEIHNGVIDLNVDGGTGLYQFLWSSSNTNQRLNQC